MKLKNILLTTAAVLTLTSCNDIKIKKNQVFNGMEYKEFVVGSELIDINQDRIPDAVMTSYDLNKNGITDCIAFYVPNMSINGRYELNPNSVGVFVDTDEDGKLDYGYRDGDGNGSLETKITKAQIEAEANKEQQRQEYNGKTYI